MAGGATLPSLGGGPSLPSVGFNPSTYATSMASAATAAILELRNIARNFHQDPIEFDFDRAPRPPELNEAERPELIDFDFQFPVAPSPLNVQLNIDDILPDQFDEEAPTLTLTAAPDAF